MKKQSESPLDAFCAVVEDANEDFEGACAASYVVLVFLFLAVFAIPSLYAALVIVGIWQVVAWALWANWTRPRLPTIWESAVGSVLIPLMPWLAVGVGIYEWFAGFSDKPGAE